MPAWCGWQDKKEASQKNELCESLETTSVTGFLFEMGKMPTDGKHWCNYITKKICTVFFFQNVTYFNAESIERDS